MKRTLSPEIYTERSIADVLVKRLSERLKGGTVENGKPSENAFNFEAVKITMSQTKDGTMIKFAIHPNDCPHELHTDPVGSRYMIALVRLEDDDTAMRRLDDEKSRALVVQRAALLCQNPKFQTWLVHMGMADKVSEEEAKKGLKEALLIESRSELKTDAVARKKFAELVRSFELDVEQKRI